MVETAKRLMFPGMDVLKAEFPLDTQETPDQTVWAEACHDISQTCSTPWILLSAAVDFDLFVRQVTVACQNGASGIAVGRAVWQEAVNLSGQDRLNFLWNTGRDPSHPSDQSVRGTGKAGDRFLPSRGCSV